MNGKYSQWLVVTGLLMASITGHSAEMLNMSTKSFVGLGDQRQVAGFVVTGKGAVKILIKAEGASLAGVLTNPLLDPMLTLKNVVTGEEILSNDNWQDNDNADEILATGSAPLDPRDPAMIVELPAGSWTAMVSGVNNTTGMAQVSAKNLSQTGSFSPFVIPQSEGKKDGITAFYLINGGKPFIATLHGTKRKVTPKGYLSVTTDAEKHSKYIHYQARLDGNEDDETIGHISMDYTQYFILDAPFPEAGTTLISSWEFSVDEWYSQFEESAPIQTIAWQRKDRGIVKPTNNLVAWIPDRDNFDDEELYPVGSTHFGMDNNGGNFAYSVNRWTETWIPDYSQKVINNDNFSPVSETWTIVAHQAQMLVLGKTYDNIVIADREYTPNFYGDETTQRATYWFAKGIGVIRSVGEYYIGDKPLTLELTETNLK